MYGMMFAGLIGVEAGRPHQGNPTVHLSPLHLVDRGDDDVFGQCAECDSECGDAAPQRWGPQRRCQEQWPHSPPSRLTSMASSLPTARAAPSCRGLSERAVLYHLEGDPCTRVGRSKRHVQGLADQHQEHPAWNGNTRDGHDRGRVKGVRELLREEPVLGGVVAVALVAAALTAGTGMIALILAAGIVARGVAELVIRAFGSARSGPSRTLTT